MITRRAMFAAFATSLSASAAEAATAAKRHSVAAKRHKKSTRAVAKAKARNLHANT
jgi:hypothetical protein